MPAGLDIKVMRMLVAIDRHGSLTRAAQALGITQSALSHHIKETERRTAVDIFHRVGKRLHLTAIGEELLQAAKSIVGEVDRIEGDLALFREGFGPGGAAGQRRLCLPWLASPLHGRTRRAGRAVRHRDPGQQPRLSPDQGRHRRQGRYRDLRRRDRRPPRAPPPSVRRRARWACCRPVIALARRGHLEAADFAAETYLSYSTIPEKGFEDERFFRPARAMPKRWRRAGDVAMILEMVRQGLGVSILSRWAVEPALERPGLVAKKPDGQGPADDLAGGHPRQ